MRTVLHGVVIPVYNNRGCLISRSTLYPPVTSIVGQWPVHRSMQSPIETLSMNDECSARNLQPTYNCLSPCRSLPELHCTRLGRACQKSKRMPWCAACSMRRVTRNIYCANYVESSDDKLMLPSFAISGTVASPLAITKRCRSTTPRHGVADGQNRAGFQM